MNLQDGKLDDEVINMIKTTRERQSEIRRDELHQKNYETKQSSDEKKQILTDFRQRGINAGREHRGSYERSMARSGLLF